MRIVISGTHASGKSTLISDFAIAHPQFDVLGDPFDLLDGVSDEPDAGLFVAQLRSSAARLLELRPRARVIAERGPLDFLAYLDALDQLGRTTGSAELMRRGAAITAQAMQHVDLLVLLPLSARDRIDVPDDEDPLLRHAMNDSLLELADDPDVVGDVATVEISGDQAARLAQLEAACVTRSSGDPTDPGPSAAERT